MELTNIKAARKHKIHGVYTELDDTLSRCRKLATEKAELEAKYGIPGL